MTSNPWPTLGGVAPGELNSARLAQHYAAQPMAAAAYALLPMQEDHSHTNLLWSNERHGFVGRALPSGHRCFLDLTALRTGLVSPHLEEVARVELQGRTLDDGFASLTLALQAVGESVPGKGLKLPEYDLPDSPLAGGAAFPAPDGAAFAELGRWFENGARALSELASAELGGAEVRGWPHHFDLAALLTLDTDLGAESARSINAGLSPGDGSYAEPYFYVTPWPAPNTRELPALAGGARWHTSGFTAAVLTGSELVGARPNQRAQIDEALRSSVAACRALLDG